MQRRSSLILGALLLTGVSGLSGCSLFLGSGDSRLDEVRADPSPTIDTLYQRPVDIDNAMVVTFDENGRMFWQDMGRVWLTDHPSRLAREPMLRP